MKQKNVAEAVGSYPILFIEISSKPLFESANSDKSYVVIMGTKNAVTTSDKRKVHRKNISKRIPESEQDPNDTDIGVAWTGWVSCLFSEEDKHKIHKLRVRQRLLKSHTDNHTRKSSSEPTTKSRHQHTEYRLIRKRRSMLFRYWPRSGTHIGSLERKD